MRSDHGRIRASNLPLQPASAATTLAAERLIRWAGDAEQP